MKLSLFLSLILPLSAFASKSDKPCEDWMNDPYLWMEEVEGAKPLQWVTEQNAITQPVIEGDPDFVGILADTRYLLTAKDRQPFSDYSRGYFWNFWRDEQHPLGVYRRTSYDEYKKTDPKWETVMDLDLLSKTEGKSWNLDGVYRLTPDSPRAMIALSDGGKDAVVLREFDLEKLEFVKDGFCIPEGKTTIGRRDENSMYVAGDYGPDSLTTSGYPRTIRLWKRGEDLAKAPEIFAGKKTDMSVGVGQYFDGEEYHTLFVRSPSFRTAERFLLEGSELRKLPLPSSAKLLAIFEGNLYFVTRDPLKVRGQIYPADSLLRIPLSSKIMVKPEVIFTPAQGEAFEHAQVRSGRILITILRHMRTRVLDLRENNGTWTSTELDLPKDGIGSFYLPSLDDPTDYTTFDYEDFTNPPAQYRAYEEPNGKIRLELLRQAPERFDPTKVETLQLFATSFDGTQIPYTVIKNKDMVYDGTNPTIMDGYGGFENSRLPAYSSTVGKIWIERGGVYVITNIRGGGEYGPAWHQAALREKRQVAFNDFAAIAEDLIARKITSPRHLGIKGGSNGGLLTGTVMLQRPELMNAALIQVPLLDMLRYHKLLAGASWMEEYGNPDREKDREWLLKYSPYQNVRADGQYPTPLFYTSTYDDRVHPAHARKMAARMLEQGHPFLYFEDMEGGHGADANLESKARAWARVYTYFWQKLKR